MSALHAERREFDPSNLQCMLKRTGSARLNILPYRYKNGQTYYFERIHFPQIFQKLWRLVTVTLHRCKTLFSQPYKPNYAGVPPVFVILITGLSGSTCFILGISCSAPAFSAAALWVCSKVLVCVIVKWHDDGPKQKTTECTTAHSVLYLLYFTLLYFLLLLYFVSQASNKGSCTFRKCTGKLIKGKMQGLVR